MPGEPRIELHRTAITGWLSKGGSVVAANCSSCHGVHDILPSSDPHSTINAPISTHLRQVPQGATAKFTLARVHMRGGDGASARTGVEYAVRWVRLDLHSADHPGDWRDVPAQRDHLAQQVATGTSCTP